MGEKLKSDFRNLQVWQKCRDLRIIIIISAIRLLNGYIKYLKTRKNETLSS